jgi:hypothetical protein
MLSYLALLCTCVLVSQLTHAFRLHTPSGALRTASKRGLSPLNSVEEDEYDPDSLFRDRVQYVDLSNAAPASETARTMPLFLLAGTTAR